MTSEFPATRGAPPPEIPLEVLRRLALLGGLWPPRSLRKCSGGWRSSGGSGPRDPSGSARAVGAPRGALAPEIPLEVLGRWALLGGLRPPRSPWKCSGG